MTDAKLFMLQVKLYDTKINAKLEELQHLKDMITKITPTLSDTPGGGSCQQDKLGDAIAKIIDLEAEIDKNVDIYVDEKKHVTDVMDQITDPVLYNVLHKRYLQYKTWEQIACEMGFSYQWVCKLHGMALQSVEKILKKKNS